MTRSNTPFAQREWEAYAVVFFLIFLPAIWLLFGYSELSTERAHKAFLAQLNGLSTALILDLNGRRVDDAGRILADLKQVKLYRGEHAPGPKPKWYEIKIRGERQTLRLFLAKSDITADKYWVFLPASDSEPLSAADRSLGTRIGGFIDPQLAEFLEAHERH